MSDECGSSPSWLFSFVDLAFLSLMAMTQITSDVVRTADLGEMVVPHVGSEVVSELSTRAHDRWQLRVHPADPEGVSPFELVHSVGGAVQGERRRLEIPELRARLQSLRDSVGRKPLLVPHVDSRSQDMLNAVALLEDLWPTCRRALVARNRT